MINKIKYIALLLFLIPILASASPQAIVNSTLEKIVATNLAFKDANKAEEHRAKLREIINPSFDFSEMSKRCLGPAWQDITAQDQNEFTRIFSELLARTYLNRIETVKPGQVAVKGEKITDQKAVVNSVVTDDGSKFTIDYRFYKGGTASEWQIYDVIIENVGLISNYRNEFSGIIRKEGFAGLMTKLQQKLDAKQ